MGITVDKQYHPDLEVAVHRLVDFFQPERIYLFGSRARGDAREDSDYDVLVVVENSQVSGFRAAQRAYRRLWGLGVSIEVLVLTRAEFERDLEVFASVPATTLREGSILYAA
jgi:uncharacterized protein